jgi:hypothetical protein
LPKLPEQHRALNEPWAFEGLQGHVIGKDGSLWYRMYDQKETSVSGIVVLLCQKQTFLFGHYSQSVTHADEGCSLPRRIIAVEHVSLHVSALVENCIALVVSL